jgi:hypothetical protein
VSAEKGRLAVELEELHRVVAADRPARRRSAPALDVTDGVALAHVVGIVGADQRVIGAVLPDQIGRQHHSVEIHPLQADRRRRRGRSIDQAISCCRFGTPKANPETGPFGPGALRSRLAPPDLARFRAGTSEESRMGGAHPGSLRFEEPVTAAADPDSPPSIRRSPPSPRPGRNRWRPRRTNRR